MFATDVPYPYYLEIAPDQGDTVNYIDATPSLLRPQYLQCPSAESYGSDQCSNLFRLDSCGQEFSANVLFPNGCDATETFHLVNMRLKCRSGVPECDGHTDTILPLDFIIRIAEDLCLVQAITSVILNLEAIATSPVALQEWQDAGEVGRPVPKSFFDPEEDVVVVILVEQDAAGSQVSRDGAAFLLCFLPLSFFLCWL